MSSPSLLVSALLAPAELILNQILKQDSLLAGKLFTHSGTVLQVDCTSPRLSIFLCVDDNRVRLSQDNQGEADAAFTGSLHALLGLLLQSEPSLHGTGITVEGDMQKAQAIQKLLSAGSIDWEYHLGRLFGEIPVQAASDLAREAARTTRHNADSLRQDLDDYIHEEARLLPGKEELEIFYAELDALKLRVDRLQARLHRFSAAG